MKKTAFYLILFLSIIYMTSCASPIQHADPFYNVGDSFSLRRIPLIKPIEAKYLDSSFPWRIFIIYNLSVPVPNKQVNTYYPYNVEELEKFAVKNGIIMAYSAYVNKEADPYIQDNYYHWFVIIPDKEIAEGFHSEDEFLEYIQTLGIQDIDWLTPEEAYKQFKQTGCLEWFPHCD